MRLYQLSRWFSLAGEADSSVAFTKPLWLFEI